MALLGDTPANTDLLNLPDSLFGVSTNGLIERINPNSYQSTGPGQYPATNTNDNAGATKLGSFQETLVATGSAVTLNTGTATNVASLVSPGSGDFDVTGMVTFKWNAATQSADSQAGISGTSATLPTDGSEGYDNSRLTTTTCNVTITLPRKRISQAANNTIYLVAKATFSAGSCTGFGEISARRAR